MDPYSRHPGSGPGSGSWKMIPILVDPDPQHCRQAWISVLDSVFYITICATRSVSCEQHFLLLLLQMGQDKEAFTQETWQPAGSQKVQQDTDVTSIGQLSSLPRGRRT